MKKKIKIKMLGLTEEVALSRSNFDKEQERNSTCMLVSGMRRKAVLALNMNSLTGMNSI